MAAGTAPNREATAGFMKSFPVHVGDTDFSRVLPAELDRTKSDEGRIKAMAFPPLRIQTPAPVLRQLGHRVRMSDTCHPQMQAQRIARAAAKDRPDTVALSFLSTTTYPAVKSMARRLKAENPKIPFSSAESSPPSMRTGFWQTPRKSTAWEWVKRRNCCRITWTT